MKHYSIVCFLACAMIFTGCAPVQIYTDSSLTEKSGFKYYTVKPYILAERELAGNNIIKATPVYLPDTENPQFMEIRDGLGSRKAELRLSDGMVNTFGISTDTKIAESVESLAALIAKSASAINDLSTLKGIPPAAPAATVTELYEVIISDGITSLRKIEIR